ncbi:MAG: metal-dependent transcriptional regulator [Nitrospinae bacterium]|nr:metal-dependent transcriptional regulator [Nitrospinota bacterium]
MIIDCKTDEYLEILWYMTEDEEATIKEFQNRVNHNYDKVALDELIRLGCIEIDEINETIVLSEKGLERARKIVRAHRLAERLLYDAIGKNIERGACEFEHVVTPELVDSICILLGHPRECPHGLPIPEGDCCRASTTTVESSVKNLYEMDIGQTARIAYMNCSSDSQLHRLNGLLVRPGAKVKLHQKYPTFVIECEGSSIAIDETIAKNIRVWSEAKIALKKTKSQRKKGIFVSLFK